MYITYEEYLKWFDPIDQTIFNRLAFEACRVMDKYTTGLDGVRKLRDHFPTDEADVETVKFTAGQLVDFLYQCHEAEQAASEGRGYTETELGLQRKIVSRVEAGNEAISYMESQGASTFVDKAVADKSVKSSVCFQLVRDGLTGVADCNGVNLLYMGVYPRR